MQPKLGDIQLKGLKVHKFSIDVAPPYAVEMAWGLQDLLKNWGGPEQAFQWNSNKLFVKPENDPITEKRVRSAGRTMAFLATKCTGEAKPKCSYEPDFTLRVSNAEESIQVAAIDGEGTVQWDAAGCHKAFNMDGTAMGAALASFRR